MKDNLTGLLSPYLRRKRIEAARPYFGSGRVLDYGCGIGNLAELIDAHRYLGVDIDKEVIWAARQKHPEHRFEDLESFQESGPFDAVIALAVIEHLSDPAAFLQWCSRLLAPGGRIVTTTPAPSLEFLHDIGGWIGLCTNEGEHPHQSLLSRKELHGLAEKVGLPLERYRRFLFGANQLAVFGGQ